MQYSTTVCVKKTLHTVGNKHRINGSIVHKQQSRAGVKQSTPHFQRVNGPVQFQRTRRCDVIKAGIKWERPKFLFDLCMAGGE